MSTGTAFRLILLTIALVAVVVVMRSLNSSKMERAFDALGLQAGGAGSPGLQAAGRPLEAGEERLNLCPTRIVAFVWNPDDESLRRSIEEEKQGMKMHWMAHDPTVREIAYLDVEKWLTGHCQIVVSPASPEAVKDLKPRRKLEIRYVNGTHRAIDEMDDHFFRIDGKLYSSPDFTAALGELRAAAQLEVPTR